MSDSNFIQLLQDKDFKERIFDAYEKSVIQRHFQKHTVIEDLRDLFMSMCNQCNQMRAQGMHHLAFTEIKVSQISNRILEIAGAGLSLSPRKQEAYLSVEAGPNGKPTAQVIFGIQGMSLMFGQCPAIQSVSFNLVHEGDVFEWLGETEIPRYSHSYLTDGNPIVASFSIIHLKAGGVLCTYLTRQDIETIAAEQIQNAQAWGQSTPWVSFLGRCVRNLILRRTFKDRAHTLALIPGSKRVDESGRLFEVNAKAQAEVNGSGPEAQGGAPMVSDEDFAALLQSSLEKG
jgi:hypothetical protein